MNTITEDKTAGILDAIESIVVTESENSIQIEWDTTTTYTNQTINVVYRLKDNSDVFTSVTSVSRDAGTITTPTTLTAETDYTIWIRPEEADFYGQWQALNALTT